MLWRPEHYLDRRPFSFPVNFGETMENHIERVYLKFLVQFQREDGVLPERGDGTERDAFRVEDIVVVFHLPNLRVVKEGFLLLFKESFFGGRDRYGKEIGRG